MPAAPWVDISTRSHVSSCVFCALATIVAAGLSLLRTNTADRAVAVAEPISKPIPHRIEIHLTCLASGLAVTRISYAQERYL